MEVHELQQEVAELRRAVRRLTALLILAVSGLLVAALAPQDSVIRARGLVITDAAGRDRVVIGAPMSEASNDRKLKDAIGVAVLDSLGRMNVAFGARTPLVLEGGRLGSRIAGMAGLTIYDPRDGKERGGMGAFLDGRANVCLDYGKGQKEAACMSVAPSDQYAAVLLNGTPDEPQFDRVVMYAGADGSGSIKVFGGGTNNGGVMMRAGNGLPKVLVFDTTGTVMRDLASASQGHGGS